MYALIIVAAIMGNRGTVYTDARTITIQDKFNSWDSCELARKHIASSVASNMRVLSQGCYTTK